jgi:hypothetical protein
MRHTVLSVEAFVQNTEPTLTDFIAQAESVLDHEVEKQYLPAVTNLNETAFH